MLTDRFQSYVERHGLFSRDDRILLTVSGGVDSMVLLSLMASLGYRFGVAHCNFQLRGAESDEDEVTVAREAARYGVPCYNRRFDTAAEMERTGESMEMTARRLRYAWFEELRREHGYAAIAVAHHADDSIETFFINLPLYPAAEGRMKLAAGWLIEQAGMKGHREGCVGVHDRQALVLVNYGGATGGEVLALAHKVQEAVRAKFGVEIAAEVNVL